MNLRNKILIGLAAFCVSLAASGQSGTSSRYNVGTGPAILGTVILQSTDGSNAAPVDSGHPLPVSASFSPSGTQDVNVKQAGGTTILTGSGATGAGSERVTVATDAATVAGSSSLPAGTNVVGKVGIDQTTPGTSNGVQVNAALPAGTNLLGKVGIDQTTPGTTNAVVDTGNVASGASDSGNPVKVGCVINTTLPTFTNGQRGDCQMGTRGALHIAVSGDTNTNIATVTTTAADGNSSQNGLVTVTQPWIFNGSTFDRQRSGGVTGIAGVSLQASPSGLYSFQHIAAGQATTTVKSGSGSLHALCLNSAATATNTTTVYDNTAASGTVIAIPAATGITTPVCLTYDLAFSTGLTIITATANGSDMTVVYK